MGDFHEITSSLPLELWDHLPENFNLSFTLVKEVPKLFDPTVFYQVRVSFVREGDKFFSAAHCQLGLP